MWFNGRTAASQVAGAGSTPAIRSHRSCSRGPVVRAPRLHRGHHGFESHREHDRYGDVAQQVGHLASNEKAAGSTPAISTTPTTSRRSKPVRWRSASCMRAHGHHTVRAPAIGYGTRSHARIAQPAERRSRKAQVRGSTPRAGSMASMTRCRSPSAVGSTPAIDGIVRVAQLAARLHDPQVVRGSIPRADTARR